MKQQGKRTYSDRELFVRYTKRLAPYKRSIYLIALFILISTIAEIINPLIIGFGIDELSSINNNFTIIIILGLTYICLSTINWLMFFLRRKEYGKFVPYFLENLRMDIFDKLQKQDIAFFDKYQSGALNTRVSNDALDFGDTTSLIAETAGNFLISILTFTILAFLNLYLALIALAAVPFVFLLMISLRKLARIVSRAYRKAIENVNNAMIESIEGIHVSKSYGQEATISSQFNEINKGYFKSTFKLTAVTHLWRHLLNIIASITLLVIVYFSGLLVIEGTLTTGTIFIFILYLQRFFRPIMVLSTFFPQLSSGMAAYERILEIFDSEPNVKQNPKAIEAEELEGEVIFEKVNFYYRDDEWVFKDFNLKIEKGEKLAIVGHTGAGKSSIAKLIARFYEFQGGDILVDGISIRNYNLKKYREQIGIIPQTPFLWADTVEKNISYGCSSVTCDDVTVALDKAGGSDWVNSLSEGLNTNVGERGNLLSMGQRQLVTFARVLLENPSILILDEATASVDPFTETRIQDALEKTMEGRTSIIIAHRLWTVRKVNRIIVIENGKIIEEGNHSELMQRGGYYAQLYNTYFRHQSLKYIEEIGKMKT